MIVEDERKKATRNEPDALGRRKTRIGLQTYSPSAYAEWNQMIEQLMQRCGCNPILAVDALRSLFLASLRPLGDDPRPDGLDALLEALGQQIDYSDELRAAKESYKKRRKP